MPQKNATPNREQKTVLARHGLRPLEWVVIKELNHSLIIKNRITGEFKVVEK